MTFPGSSRTAALAIAALFALAACNKSSTPTPTPTATPAPPNISGDYTGTITDSETGSAVTGNASGTLSQHGASAGGSMSDTETAPAQTLIFNMALTMTSATAFTGTMVVDYPPSGTGPSCTFTTSGTYTNNGTTSATLNGTYSATTNCSGDSGTFALTQTCSATVAITSADRRRMGGFPPSC
jgi:hypothetical protein